MMRSGALRAWTGLLLFGLFAVLTACGSMGGNDEGDDDNKFPEPPDRPSSAQVGTPPPDANRGSIVQPRDGSPLVLRPRPPTFT